MEPIAIDNFHTKCHYFFLVSCKQKSHKDLISFNSKFHRDLTQEEWDGNPDFETAINDSVHGDTLFIKILKEGAGCMRFDGDIQKNQDTLFLNYWHKNDEACTELVIYKLEYKVLNQERKDYKLKLRYL